MTIFSLCVTEIKRYSSYFYFIYSKKRFLAYTSAFIGYLPSEKENMHIHQWHRYYLFCADLWSLAFRSNTYYWSRNEFFSLQISNFNIRFEWFIKYRIRKLFCFSLKLFFFDFFVWSQYKKKTQCIQKSCLINELLFFMTLIYAFFIYIEGNLIITC